MGASLRSLSVLALLAAGLAGSARGQAIGPRDIVAGPDGNLWFTESAAGRIGRISTAGVVTDFELPPASSVEVVVKVLDGCPLNAHSWVFAAGLTNVGVTLTGTDIQTDVVRTYTNPADTPFAPVQDTTALETCP